MKMLCRRLTPADNNILNSFVKNVEQLHPEADLAHRMENIQKAFRYPNFHFFGVFAQDQLLAASGVFTHFPEKGYASLILFMSIANDLRRLATAINACFEVIDQENCHTIRSILRKDRYKKNQIFFKQFLPHIYTTWDMSSVWAEVPVGTRLTDDSVYRHLLGDDLSQDYIIREMRRMNESI